jgi:hypothetical protein
VTSLTAFSYPPSRSCVAQLELELVHALAAEGEPQPKRHLQYWSPVVGLLRRGGVYRRPDLVDLFCKLSVAAVKSRWVAVRNRVRDELVRRRRLSGTAEPDSELEEIVIKLRDPMTPEPKARQGRAGPESTQEEGLAKRDEALRNLELARVSGKNEDVNHRFVPSLPPSLPPSLLADATITRRA